MQSDSEFDENNPADPILVGKYNTPGFAYDVAVNGDKVYVADGSEGLLILQFP